MNRTDRLYAIAEALRAAGDEGRTAAWLAERFEVATRTIKRDVTALQDAGQPIYGLGGRGGGYRIDPAATLAPVAFTPGEVIALATLLAIDADAPYAVEGRRALAKVLDAIGLRAGRCGGARWSGVGPRGLDCPRPAPISEADSGCRGRCRPPGGRRPRLRRCRRGGDQETARRAARLRPNQRPLVPHGLVSVAAGRPVVPSRPHRRRRPHHPACSLAPPRRRVR